MHFTLRTDTQFRKCAAQGRFLRARSHIHPYIHIICIYASYMQVPCNPPWASWSQEQANFVVQLARFSVHDMSNVPGPRCCYIACEHMQRPKRSGLPLCLCTVSFTMSTEKHTVVARSRFKYTDITRSTCVVEHLLSLSPSLSPPSPVPLSRLPLPLLFLTGWSDIVLFGDFLW